jgi:hypothetical protein
LLYKVVSLPRLVSIDAVALTCCRALDIVVGLVIDELSRTVGRGEVAGFVVGAAARGRLR